MRIRKSILAVALLVAVLYPVLAIPQQVAIQGRLTNSTGGLEAEKCFNMTFQIYDALSGGNLLYTEQYDTVASGCSATTTCSTGRGQVLKTSSEGVFNANLGSCTSINLPFDADYYLELIVNKSSLSPRHKITSAAYTFRSNVTDFIANNAQAVGNLSVANNLSVGSGTLFVDSTGSSVGIGTSSPSYQLDVSGVIYADKSVYSDPSGEDGYRIKIQDYGGTTNDAGIGIASSTGPMWFNNVASGGFYFNDGTNGRVLTLKGSTGFVGIGATTPTARLDVRGGINASSLNLTSLTNCDTIDTDANGVLSCGTDSVGSAGAQPLWNRSGTYVYLNKTSDYVGIGTKTPSQVLDVSGNIITSGSYYLSGLTSAYLISSELRLNAGGGSTIRNLATQDGATLTIQTGNNVNDLNHIIFSPGGTESVRFQENGNVGIGTSSPSEMLTVTGNASIGSTLYVNSTTNRVGINTSSPDELLEVQGTYAGDGAHIGNAYIGVWDTSNGYTVFVHNSLKGTTGSYALSQSAAGATYLNSASGQDLDFRINNADKMTLSSTGKFGIGTTTPSEVLTVIGNASIDGSTFVVNSTTGRVGINTTTPNYALDVNGDLRINNTIYSSDGTSPTITLSNSVGSDLAYGTSKFRAGSSNLEFIVGGSEKARFTTTGLGIGTTNPRQDLEVVGNLNVTGTAYIGTQNFINLGASGNMTLGGNLSVNNTLFVDSSVGRVGIKTSNPSDALDIAYDSGATLTGISANGGLHFKMDGGNDDFVGITASSAGASSNTTQGGILFQGSSSYGTKIHFLTTDSYAAGQKDRMIIDHKGNVGIGTTNPSENLHVAGASTPGIAIEDTTNSHWGTFTAGSSGSGIQYDNAFYLQHDDDGTIGGSATTTLMGDSSGNVGIGTTSPSEQLTVAGNASIGSTLYVNSTTGRVGIGTTSAKKGILNVFDDRSTSSAGYAINATRSISSSGFYDHAAVYSETNAAHSSGTLSLAEATESVLKNSGAGTLTYGYGSLSYVDAVSGTITNGYGTKTTAQSSYGTLTNGYGLYSNVDSATNTITNGYGLYTSIGGGTGSVTNGYGLYIADVIATTDYGIYQAGSNDNNYFAGNVGIGETNPTSLLYLKADDPTITLKDTTDSRPGIISMKSSVLDIWAAGATASGGDITFRSGYGSGKVKMALIGSTGNLGIGTTSPANTLHVNSTTNGFISGAIIEGRRDGGFAALQLRARDGSTPTSALPANQGPGLYFAGFDGTNFRNMSAILSMADTEAISSTDSSSFLSFYTTPPSSTSMSEVMRIDEDGNVGIGTTSPAAKFEVSESTAGTEVRSRVYHSGTSGSSHATFLSTVNGASSGDPRIGFFISGVTGWTVGADNSDNDKFKIANSGSLGFTTTNLAIDTSGNVGIGTTSPDGKLEISSTTDPTLVISPGGDTTVDPKISLNDTGIGAGFDIWYDNSIGSTYFDSRYDSGGGDIFFRTKTKGTPIDALTIESAGKVGIGTTGPSNLLHVRNDSNARRELAQFENPNTGTSSAASIKITGQGNNLFLTSYGDNHASRSGESWLHSTAGSTDVVIGAQDGLSGSEDTIRIGGGNVIPDDDVAINTNDLYVDASSSRVGILDKTPDAVLDIYNSGSGDSFRVDDSIDGDSTPFIINGSGIVFIGNSKVQATAVGVPKINIFTSGNDEIGLFSQANLTGTSGTVVGILGKARDYRTSTSSTSYMYGITGKAEGTATSTTITYGVWGAGSGGTTNWDFYAGGTGTNYGPFTGAHEVKLELGFPEIIQSGLIVSTTGEVGNRNNSISSTLPEVRLSNISKDPKVLGAIVSETFLPPNHWYYNLTDEGDKFASVNALGEGRLWVTNIKGGIQSGDYITTSKIAGYGQKQDDDLMHSYTVAKATETVDWNKVTDIITYNGTQYKKYLIGVTYHSG